MPNPLVVNALGEFTNPRQKLILLSWNIGSLHSRLSWVLQLLQDHKPHALFLQEASDANGAVAALRVEVRTLGYCIHFDAHSKLITVHLRGLNIAPLRPEEIDQQEVGYVQRFAWQITDTRVLVRHRHGHPNCSVSRKALNTVLGAEPVGEAVIDIGDFNEQCI